jgi:seryl-tRNA synthetase
MSDQSVDIEEQQFAEAIAKARHKEQMGVLKGIATLLNKPEKPNDDKQIIDAINKQGAAIEKVAAAIQNQPKPEVNVGLDSMEIVTLLREVKQGQVAIIEAFGNRPMVEKFDFEKDNWGGIKTAKVIYTPANQITIKKSKYQA